MPRIAIIIKPSIFVSVQIDRILAMSIFRRLRADIYITEHMELEKYSGYDFLLYDLYQFGTEPFLERSRLGQKMGFICFLHSVLCWFRHLVLIRPLLAGRDVLVAPSGYATNSLAKLYRNYAPVEIPYFLEVESLRKMVPGQAVPYSVAYLGRLREDKGVMHLVRAIEMLRGRFPEIRLSLIGPLAGDTLKDEESGFVRSVKDYVSRRRLQRHVSFTGLLVGEKKYRLLAKHSLLALPTTCNQEAQPFSVVEAFACGMPVVATRWAALDGELVEDGRNGFLVGVRWEQQRPSVSYAELALQIERFFRLPEGEKGEMSGRAAHSSQRFSAERVIPLLEGILRKKGQLAPAEPGTWEAVKGRKIRDSGEIFSEFVTGDARLGELTFEQLHGMPHNEKELLRQAFIEERTEAFFR